MSMLICLGGCRDVVVYLSVCIGPHSLVYCGCAQHHVISVTERMCEVYHTLVEVLLYTH